MGGSPGWRRPTPEREEPLMASGISEDLPGRVEEVDLLESWLDMPSLRCLRAKSGSPESLSSDFLARLRFGADWMSKIQREFRVG